MIKNRGATFCCASIIYIICIIQPIFDGKHPKQVDFWLSKTLVDFAFKNVLLCLI